MDSTLTFYFVGDDGVGKDTLMWLHHTGVLLDGSEGQVLYGPFENVFEIESQQIKVIYDALGVLQDGMPSGVTESYMKDSDAIFLCFSIDNMESFINVAKYHDFVCRQNLPHIQLMLVAMKKDLEATRQVPEEDITEYAEKLGIDCIEVSSKINLNVSTLFKEMIKKCLKRQVKIDKTVVMSRCCRIG